MAELSQESKQLIDGLPSEELLEEINKGTSSRFQNEKFAYVKTRYAVLQGEQEATHKQQTLAVAEESNKIATEALATSKKSYVMATLAVVITLVALVIQYFIK